MHESVRVRVCMLTQDRAGTGPRPGRGAGVPGSDPGNAGVIRDCSTLARCRVTARSHHSRCPLMYSVDSDSAMLGARWRGGLGVQGVTKTWEQLAKTCTIRHRMRQTNAKGLPDWSRRPRHRSGFPAISATLLSTLPTTNGTYQQDGSQIGNVGVGDPTGRSNHLSSISPSPTSRDSSSK